jgi:hypothetical protein
MSEPNSAEAVAAQAGKCPGCGGRAGIAPLFGMPMGACVLVTFVCADPECATVISTQFVPLEWMPAPVRAALEESIASMIEAAAAAGDSRIIAPGMDDISPNLRNVLELARKRRTQ